MPTALAVDDEPAIGGQQVEERRDEGSAPIAAPDRPAALGRSADRVRFTEYPDRLAEKPRRDDPRPPDTG